MRIDAHQHFFDLNRFEYDWMPPGPSRLRQNFMPDWIAPILHDHNFDGGIATQAIRSLEETRWLLELSDRFEMILGVAGWVDLTDARVGQTLDELQRHPRFVGVKVPAHREDDPQWLLREDVLQGLGEVSRRNLPFDLMITPRQLAQVAQIAERIPNLRMAIDHIAKPPIASHELEPWASDIAETAKLPQVYSKLSGLITEAEEHWAADQVRPYVQHVFRCFGPRRLMFGSDWPICLSRGTWKAVLATFTQALGALQQETREQLLGLTALEFYRLPDRPRGK